MKIKTLYNKYSEQAKEYNIELESILLMHFSRATRRGNYERANKLREAAKIARIPLKLVRLDNSNNNEVTI